MGEIYDRHGCKDGGHSCFECTKNPTKKIDFELDIAAYDKIIKNISMHKIAQEI